MATDVNMFLPQYLSPGLSRCRSSSIENLSSLFFLHYEPVLRPRNNCRKEWRPVWKLDGAGPGTHTPAAAKPALKSGSLKILKPPEKPPRLTDHRSRKHHPFLRRAPFP